jgi:hypothetical protein
MSLYFSVAVWASLALAGLALVRHTLPRYRARRAVVVPVRSSHGLR